MLISLQLFYLTTMGKMKEGLININAKEYPSSETQGQLVGAGKRLNGRGKKLGEEKSRTKVGAPGILLLIDQFRNHLKSLPVIGHKNIFCAQSESSSFRVTFVTSYSKVFTAKLFARLFAIYLLARAGEFPSIEKCHWNANHETEKKPPNLGCL